VKALVSGKSAFATGDLSVPATSNRLRSRRLDGRFAPDQAPNGSESSRQADLPNRFAQILKTFPLFWPLKRMARRVKRNHPV